MQKKQRAPARNVTLTKHGSRCVSTTDSPFTSAVQSLKPTVAHLRSQSMPVDYVMNISWLSSYSAVSISAVLKQLHTTTRENQDSAIGFDTVMFREHHHVLATPIAHLQYT